MHKFVPHLPAFAGAKGREKLGAHLRKAVLSDLPHSETAVQMVVIFGLSGLHRLSIQV